MNRVNWNLVMSVVPEDSLRNFCVGNLSGRTLTTLVEFTDAAGEVRKLLRAEGGIRRARDLTRKALERHV